MTNFEALQQFSPEEMAAFLTNERFAMMKPIIEHFKFKCFIHPQIVQAKLLKWLNSEVIENE